MNMREKILRHLDLNSNHEAGLIPQATRLLLEDLAARIEPLLENLPDASKPAPVACHFCDNGDVVTLPTDNPLIGRDIDFEANPVFHCHCPFCAADGPTADTRDGAVDMWNSVFNGAEQ